MEQTMLQRRTLGTVLLDRSNSLNFLRLALALMVVEAHSFDFFPRQSLVDINDTGLGIIAVYGFFGISGYLIASSASKRSHGRFLWQRFLRIFPAFWLCLLVTALIFGPINWLTQAHSCGSLSCYVTSPNGPVGFLAHNAWLRIHQTQIAGTPRAASFPPTLSAWNPSLWTLFYEFACYLILWSLAVLGLLRRRAVVLAMTVTLLICIAVITATPSLRGHFTLVDNFTLLNLMKLSAVFLVGSCIYLYRDAVPDSFWIALVCAVGFVASLALPNDGRSPDFAFTFSRYFAPLIVYPLLWLGAHLPFQRVGSRNDYSYGIYIYAYPVQWMLATAGLVALGYYPFLFLTMAGALACGVASWWAIEKHALKLKSVRLPAVVTRSQLLHRRTDN
jgi:peptidoglycan/LPS O-acetylase OafA/YrhL